MNQATTALATASGEVINSHDQFEVSGLILEDISMNVYDSFVGLQRSPSCMSEFPVYSGFIIDHAPSLTPRTRF